MNQKTIILVALLPFALASCGRSKPSDTPEREQRLTISDPPSQCSRPTVRKGNSYFMPSRTDVSHFEQIVASRLKQQGGAAEKLKREYNRSYVGIDRRGRRTIYGDFWHLTDGPTPSITLGRWGGVVCDGGPAFFGAEYDPIAKTVTTMKNNGLPNPERKKHVP